MRQPKEIVILLVLLVCAMAAVLWYVLDRRARMHNAPAVAGVPAELAPAPSGGLVPAKAAVQSAAPPATPLATPSAMPARPAGQPVAEQPVDLTKHDGQTIDFSSGQPVVKQSPADKAALDAGLKDIADATKDVTFGPPPKQSAEAAPAPSKP